MYLSAYAGGTHQETMWLGPGLRLMLRCISFCIVLADVLINQFADVAFQMSNEFLYLISPDTVHGAYIFVENSGFQCAINDICYKTFAY